VASTLDLKMIRNDLFESDKFFEQLDKLEVSSFGDGVVVEGYTALFFHDFLDAAAFRQYSNPSFAACFLFWRMSLHLCYHVLRTLPLQVIVGYFNHLTRGAWCPVFIAKKLVTFCDIKTLI